VVWLLLLVVVVVVVVVSFVVVAWLFSCSSVSPHVLLHVLFCSPQCSVCLLLLGFLLVLGSSSKERERERERERESYYV
jgi:flagellar basal body-associated protein FliL